MLVYLAGHFAISDQMFFQEAKAWNLIKWGEPTEPVPHTLLKLPPKHDF